MGHYLRHHSAVSHWANATTEVSHPKGIVQRRLHLLVPCDAVVVGGPEDARAVVWIGLVLVRLPLPFVMAAADISRATTSTTPPWNANAHDPRITTHPQHQNLRTRTRRPPQLRPRRALPPTPHPTHHLTNMSLRRLLGFGLLGSAGFMLGGGRGLGQLSPVESSESVGDTEAMIRRIRAFHASSVGRRRLSVSMPDIR